MVDNGLVLELLFNPANLLLAVIGLGLLALKVWAVIDCALAPQGSFEAHGKLSKLAWLAILILGLLLGRGGVYDLFAIVGTVAAIVYFVDVRPAVRGTANPWN